MPPQAEQDLEPLRYPVGRFRPDADVSAAARTEHIRRIAAVPGRMRDAVLAVGDRLDQPYRPGGWTARQVVHHVADSHVNAYVRFRWTLTEDAPLIKTYDEAAWAELPDARTLPVEASLILLDALHRRWVALLGAMDDAAFRRRLQHPEQGPVDLDFMLQLYAWHGEHHAAHLRLVAGR